MDQLAINTIRMLVVDAVQKAKSGHPGTPMDAAPTAYTLWQRVLRYDPADPGLDQSRPLRAVQRPRIDAALQPDPSRRHQGGEPELRAGRPGRGHAGRHQRPFVRPAAVVRGIRNMAGPRASRRQRGRSVRASRPASAWRSPGNGWAPPITGRASICSISTSTRCAATAT